MYHCAHVIHAHHHDTCCKTAPPLTPCQAVDNLQGVFDRDWNSVYTRPLPPFTPN